MRIGTVWLTLAIGAFGGCHKPGVPALNGPGGSAACGDPCAAMTCPAGMSCTWNTSCQPRCEAQPIAPAFGH